MSRLSVVVVDDQAMIRTGFRMILDAEADIAVVGEAADGLEALEVVTRHRPEVVLMDVRMNRMDGIEATRRLVSAPDPPRVLILTTFDLDEHVHDALRAGASGFLLKDAPPEQLIEAVRTVAAGEALLAPSVTRRMIERFVTEPPHHPDASALAVLTAREREVLELVARALSNAEIAASLHLGEATVKTHVARVLMKLGLRDRVQAVAYAYEHGVVRPGRG